jgi:rare lipoprotein A (peptidoglycan hydrolase)
MALKAASRGLKPILFVAAQAVMALLLAVIFTCPSTAQPVQDSLMSREEQARALEKDIVSLEVKLAQVKEDAISIAQRLSEIEKNILQCYMEIDQAQAEVENARRKLDNRFRALYIEGRQDPLIQLMSSTSVTDFLVWYQSVMDVASSEVEAYRDLKTKRKHLQDVQDKLQAFKVEQAHLNETADTSALEAEIALKQGQLADISATLIAMQLPASYTPAPETFDPGRVYARPDENGFTRTGQVFSGYSSWYGQDFNGKATASGEVFDQYAFTCAHPTLPFGTYLRVTFLGRSVIVKVNDRGPFVKGRMLDLSRGAAESIGLTGVQWVDCEIVVPRT